MAEDILNQVHASDLFDLRGVVAVVTGGGTGIGLMITTTLVSNGAAVYIIGPSQTDLDKVAKVYNDAAEKLGKEGRIYGIEGDIRTKDEAIRLVTEIGKRSPYVTVLFNNAGIADGMFTRPTELTAKAFQEAYFNDLKPEVFDNVMRTNAFGPYWLTFAFLPLLEKWKEVGYSATTGGRKFAPQVIMTSSMNGWTKDNATGGKCFPYQFSKSAIGHATSTIAHELLPLGIRVNGIAPGLFITEMTAPGTANLLGISNIPRNTDVGFEVPCAHPSVSQATGEQPVRSGSFADMGAVVLCLVSNWFVNGETILIDGGTMLVHANSF